MAPKKTMQTFVIVIAVAVHFEASAWSSSSTEPSSLDSACPADAPTDSCENSPGNSVNESDPDMGILLQVKLRSSAAEEARWTDRGAGCCSGARDLAHGKLFADNVANFEACKAKCLDFQDRCGTIEYGWAGSTWCFVWSTANSCSSLAQQSWACGGGGGHNGVHAYTYDATTTEAATTTATTTEASTTTLPATTTEIATTTQAATTQPTQFVDPWLERGAGCCSGPRDAAHGKIFAGNLASLDACKAKCESLPNCGAVEYGWYASPWCFIWSTANPCSSLDTAGSACGSGGNTGVHTYAFDASKTTTTTTAAAQQSNGWTDRGPGCCSGDRTTAGGKLWANKVADLDACKEKCTSSFQEGCGAIEYGWPASTWCFIWSTANSCSSLKSCPPGVHAYTLKASDYKPDCGPGQYSGVWPKGSCQCGAVNRSGSSCELPGICRFSTSYDWQSNLIDNVEAQKAYVSKMLRWDGKFAAPGRGITAASFLTCDSVYLTLAGEPSGAGYYTAASKESLHLSMLALVVSKTPLAWNWIDEADDETAAVSLASKRLEQIISQYEKFDAAFPGLGGFIPWVGVGAAGFLQDKTKNVALPALDNGQLAWSFLAVVEGLKVAGNSALAARFSAHVDKMKQSAPTLFLDPASGKVFMVSTVADPRSPVSSSNRAGSGYLVDPYEGELMLMFLDLMCNWEDVTKKQYMWYPVKRNQIPVKYTHPGLPNGSITVQRGWRFSSHELWKYFVLPYRDDPHVFRVLANGERARTWNSKLKNIPGLMASTYTADGKYMDTFGVPEISMGYPQPSNEDLMVTPYGAFPLMLVSLGHGLAWHRAMLARPHMQNILGSTESSQAFGTGVAHKNTWDTKVTTDVAVLGGTGDLLRKVIQEEQARSDRWAGLLAYLYEPFTTLEGEHTTFAEAPTYVSEGSSPEELDFPNCVRMQTPEPPM